MQPPVPAMCKMRIPQLCINVHHHLSATAPRGARQNHPNILSQKDINSQTFKIEIEHTWGGSIHGDPPNGWFINYKGKYY